MYRPKTVMYTPGMQTSQNGKGWEPRLGTGANNDETGRAKKWVSIICGRSIPFRVRFLGKDSIRTHEELREESSDERCIGII